jgi:transcriptional regulator with XRE-family HTH domain
VSRPPRERYETAFGQALAAQLSERGVTQRGLASSTGVSPAYINRMMTGSARPSSGWADLVADALGVPALVRQQLHTAAAKDAGFKLDLTKPTPDSGT